METPRFTTFFSYFGAQSVEAYTQHSNMNSLGQGGSLSNGGREAACRSSGRLGEADNTISVPRDHPMLQTGNQSQEVKKTHYPYKEPRIDQRMYQAEIPRLQGRASNRAVTRGSSSPRAGEKCTKVCAEGLKYVPCSLSNLTEMSNASRSPRCQRERGVFYYSPPTIKLTSSHRSQRVACFCVSSPHVVDLPDSRTLGPTFRAERATHGYIQHFGVLFVFRPPYQRPRIFVLANCRPPKTACGHLLCLEIDKVGTTAERIVIRLNFAVGCPLPTHPFIPTYNTCLFS